MRGLCARGPEFVPRIPHPCFADFFPFCVAEVALDTRKTLRWWKGVVKWALQLYIRLFYFGSVLFCFFPYSRYSWRFQDLRLIFMISILLTAWHLQCAWNHPILLIYNYLLKAFNVSVIYFHIQIPSKSCDFLKILFMFICPRPLSWWGYQTARCMHIKQSQHMVKHYMSETFYWNCWKLTARISAFLLNSMQLFLERFKLDQTSQARCKS